MVQVATTGSWLSCLACYGGGVILATCFTHMMPEVVRQWCQSVVSVVPVLTGAVM